MALRLLLIVCVALLGSLAHAAPREPFLSQDDIDRLTAASAAIAAKDWTKARTIAPTLGRKPVRDLVQWRLILAEDSDVTFQEVDSFIKLNKSWPRQADLKRRAEKLIAAAALSPEAVIDWFAGNEPVTGSGCIALGDAYAQKDQAANATKWIRRAWSKSDLTAAQVTRIGSAYAQFLTAAEHQQRATALIWNGELTGAQAMKPYLSADWRTLIDARVKLRQRTKDADKAFNAVKGALRNDAGLLFDRAVFLRKAGKTSEARTTLVQASASTKGNVPNAEAWWAERQYQAREALNTGEIHEAYKLAAGHRLTTTTGNSFSEAEFLSGWIALRFLNKPDVALTHFDRIRANARSPISIARGNYWMARSFEKTGRPEDAIRQFKAAANYPQTFYGQLAATALGPKALISLPRVPTPSTARERAFMGQDTIVALQALADIGDRPALRSFALALADQMTEAEDLILLSELSTNLGELVVAIRVAKRGIQKNLPLHKLAYPTVDLPDHAGLGEGPEKALVLALIRQESEFNRDAISPVGAMGLMQVMPATAKQTARTNGITLRGNDDLLNPDTNAKIGMSYLSDLLRDFQGSYVLSIAAYNAGPSRANAWASAYGDPRLDITDVVDWVERIPFSETRNYVQRVLENTQMYRRVLAGRDVEVGLAADLTRGGSKFVPPAEPNQSEQAQPKS